VRIFTIGHGDRSSDELLACLAEAGVQTLVDVRRFPGSRRHPQFNLEALERTVGEAGIAYRHAESLGGRRSGGAEFDCIRVAAFRGYAAWMRSDAFAAGLADALAQPGPCFMCAETLWWRCHRRLIADAAVLLAGIDVVHLVGTIRQPHRLTSGVRRDGERLFYDGTSG
jgi:uncharacterized protein (DUF488 family)